LTDDTFLLPLPGMPDIYLGLPSEVRQTAIDATVKRMEKLAKSLNGDGKRPGIGEQVDALNENTPWRIAHEKRALWLTTLEQYLDARDTLRRLGVNTG